MNRSNQEEQLKIDEADPPDYNDVVPFASSNLVGVSEFTNGNNDEDDSTSVPNADDRYSPATDEHSTSNSRTNTSLEPKPKNTTCDTPLYAGNTPSITTSHRAPMITSVPAGFTQNMLHLGADAETAKLTPQQLPITQQQQLHNRFSESYIKNKTHQKEFTLNQEEQTATVNAEGTATTHNRHLDSPSKTNKLQSLVDEIATLECSQVSKDATVLRLQLEEGLKEMELNGTDELHQLIVAKKEEIRSLEAQGKSKAALKRRGSLLKLEELQSLADEIATLECSHVSKDASVLRLQLEEGLKEMELNGTDELHQLIVAKKEEIRSLEAQGKSKAALKRRDSLLKLEELQSLADEIATLDCSHVSKDASVLRLQLEEGLKEMELNDTNELRELIAAKKEEIRSLEAQGKSKSALKRQDSLSKLEELQSFVDEIATLECSQVSKDASVLRLQLEEGLKEMELNGTDELHQLIVAKKEEIRSLEAQGKSKAALKRRDSLLKLEELQSLADEIATLDCSHVSKDASVLRLQLEEGLKEMELNDTNELRELIAAKKEEIRSLEAQGKSKAALKRRDSLSKLEELQSLVDEIATLECSQVSKDATALRLQLEEGLKDMELNDTNELRELIAAKKEEIRSLEAQGKSKAALKRRDSLSKLEELEWLVEEMGRIGRLNDSTTIKKDPLPSTNPDVPVTILNKRMRLYLEELEENINSMPRCAEKIAMQLLHHFEKKLHGGSMSSDEESVSTLLQEFGEQIKEQELFSYEITSIFQNLERTVKQDSDYENAIRFAKELLRIIRPLDIQELERLVEKANTAADLIRDKDVVLLIGDTGVGKSTTIQFLAGCEMRETKVELEPGSFLDHIEAVELKSYAGLKEVISSPECKSETKYITPITIPLKDILDSWETEDIILCDAPGFGDTSGPEVDIANGVGIVEALKSCRSVKILALSSYKGLGDRAQGIQRLAQFLIKMINKIEERLDAIYYAFTKYPPREDVHAYMLNIKKNVVDKDHMLASDIAFVGVLKDMLKKTKEGAQKIDPIRGDRKVLIKTLRTACGIEYPQEVFRFSMSEDTRKTVLNEVQRYEMKIRLAVKHKTIDLTKYYLDNLKLLKDVIDESFINDAYQQCVRFISEHIEEYCSRVVEKFNRVFESHDGLRKEDIIEYKKAMEYNQTVQNRLGGHIQADRVSFMVLVENIHFQTEKTRKVLENEDLSNHIIAVYLGNIHMLKDSLQEFEPTYKKICDIFEERFNTTVISARELISAHQFTQVADVILVIYKSSQYLKIHLGESAVDRYRKTVAFLLDDLSGFNKKAAEILSKDSLTENDVKVLDEYMTILRSAKDTLTLHDRLSVYVDALKNQADYCFDSFKSLNEIYNEFIERIVIYYNNINAKISGHLKGKDDYDLERIEKLIGDMNTIRKIPEIEIKTSGAYYQIIENVHGYMQELKNNFEQLIETIEKRSDKISYTRLARLLPRLRYIEWMDRVKPGAYAKLKHFINDELLGKARKLEDELKRIDFPLKNHKNVLKAECIVEEIESMSRVEDFVPEIKDYRIRIQDLFRNTTQAVFDSIQKMFNLQSRDVYTLKQNLNELESIKHEYHSLHPAQKHLKEHGYADVFDLNNEIKDITEKIKEEDNIGEALKVAKEKELKMLDDIITQYYTTNAQGSDQSVFRAIFDRIKMSWSTVNSFDSSALRESNFSQIDEVHEAKLNTTRRYANNLQLIQESCKRLKDDLNHLEKTISKYKDLLLVSSDSISAEETQYLQSKNHANIESLNIEIQEKKKIIAEREKNKQVYDFSSRFDGDTANNAVLYLNECKKVKDFQVANFAHETEEILQRYLDEYGHFLSQEIARLYQNTIDSDVEGGPLQYSHELRSHLEELSSLRRFPEVFKSIKGEEKVVYWSREIANCYATLSHKIQEYQDRGDNENLRKQLTVVHAMSCLDRHSGDNRFNDLYNRHQLVIWSDVKETYKSILNYIAKRDFASASMALSDIDDHPLNQRAKRQMEHAFESSLRELMKDTICTAQWLYGKIEGGIDNRAPIEEIKENIEKIRIALARCNLMDLLGKSELKADLEKFPDEIDRILSENILEGLNIIEEQINADNFAEVEEGIFNISKIQRELTGIITSQKVIDKTSELRDKLGKLVKNLLNGDHFSEIDKYFERPPKDLLAKLKRVSVRNSQYQQAYTTLLERLRRKFNQNIEELKKTSIKEQHEKIPSLEYALVFMPEELQGSFKAHIEEMKRSIKLVEKKWEEELGTCLTNGDDSDSKIINMKTLAKSFKENTMYELSERLHDSVVKRLVDYRTSLKGFLDACDMQSALLLMEKIIKYKKEMAAYVPKVTEIYQTAHASIVKGFESCSTMLADISKIDPTEAVENAFHNTVVFIKFLEKQSENEEEIIPASLVEHSKMNLQNIYKYLQNNSEKYRGAEKTTSVSELYTTMEISKKWNRLLDKMRDLQNKNGTIRNLLPGVQSVLSYNDMISRVTKMVESLKTELNVELISDETTRFERKRKDFFMNLRNLLNKLTEIDANLQDFLSTPVNAKQSEECIKTKGKGIGEKLLQIASSSEFTDTQYDHFRKYYQHLSAIHQYLDLPGIEAQSTLDTAKEKIFRRVMSFCQRFIDSRENFDKAAEALIMVKSFAENLPMFGAKINANIDESLKKCKQQNGARYLTSLSMQLENTDIGRRIMSEHALLSGEDWRKRREKMQRQDDLEYILQHLEGDALDKEVLRTRFKRFRETYDDLLKQNLKSLDEKSQSAALNVLVSNTRCLVERIIPNAGSFCLNQSFKDKIPELLAHVFCIWTLQNTEHYNKNRGLATQDAYLLMPHAAQIISIFRIFGIGYQSSESADKLSNNLVQIGTGEGKSVVMAAVACIFALAEVEVNCSCYSDVLSKRDKEAFNSLFTVLGIQKYIEYGTFNKLCENILNQQCDVREKVRSMIMNNKAASEVVEKKCVNIPRYF